MVHKAIEEMDKNQSNYEEAFTFRAAAAQLFEITKPQPSNAKSQSTDN